MLAASLAFCLSFALPPPRAGSGESTRCASLERDLEQLVARAVGERERAAAAAVDQARAERYRLQREKENLVDYIAETEEVRRASTHFWLILADYRWLRA